MAGRARTGVAGGGFGILLTSSFAFRRFSCGSARSSLHHPANHLEPARRQQRFDKDADTA